MDTPPAKRQADFFPPAPPGYLAAMQQVLRDAAVRWDLPPDFATAGQIVAGDPFPITTDDIRPDHIAVEG